MNLNRDVAKQITEKTKKILGKKIIITDEKGSVIFGARPGDFNLYAYQSILRKSVIEEKNDERTTWSPLTYEGQVIGAVGIEGAFKEIKKDTIDLIQGLSEVLIYQEILLCRIYSIDRARSGFIREVLLEDTLTDENQIYDQADILRINLKANQAVILGYVKGLEENFLSSLQKLSQEEKMAKFEEHISKILADIRKAFEDNDQNVPVYFGNNLFLLLKGIRGSKITTENSTRFFKSKGEYFMDKLKEITGIEDITVGVGQFYPGLEGLKNSFNDAKLALEIGCKIWGPGKLYHILDVGIFISLAPISHQRKSDLTYQLLKPLLDDVELKKTVDVFLTNGMNLTEAAEELHVHRNTLIYRLDKVKKVIKLDPRTFNGAMQIKLGLMLSSLK